LTVRAPAASFTSSAPAATCTVTVTVTGAASSLVMVPTPCASVIVALAGAVRLTKNVSFGSVVMSPLTLTVRVVLVAPAGIVSTVAPMAV
jgi:hypothetical protein